MGCWGGESKYAFSYAAEQGLTSWDEMPYKNGLGSCDYDPETQKVYQTEGFKIYERINNYDLEKLVCEGAVAVPVRINDCFKNYAGGILTNEECGCNSRLGMTNHAVTIVGFGKEIQMGATCEHYWIVRNSWGPEWGEDGYIRICKDDEDEVFGTCNMRKEAILPLGSGAASEVVE